MRQMIHAALLFAALLAGAGPARADRSWTARDSIGVRYVLGAGQASWGAYGDPPDRPFVWSPRRDYFYFVTRRGRLDCDCNEFELIVHSARSVQDRLGGTRRPGSLAPLRRLVRLSHESSDGLMDMEWDTRGPPAIIFRSPDRAGIVQLFRFMVETGDLEQLTRASGDVLRPYSVVGSRAIHAIYSRGVPTRSMDRYPMAVVDHDVLLNELIDRRTIGRFAIETNDAPSKRLLEYADDARVRLWVSPDGRSAILRAVITRPEDDRAGTSAILPSPQSAVFSLIDLSTGSVRTLETARMPQRDGSFLDANAPALVTWSPDSRRAFIANGQIRATPGQAASLGAMACRVETADCSLVARFAAGSQASAVNWDREALRVEFRGIEGQANGRLYVESADGNWVERQGGPVNPAPAVVTAPFTLALAQSANDPPIAVARWNGREISLIEADSALAGLERATSREVSWVERDGRRMSGQLYLPPRSASASPPPVVIVPWEPLPDYFLPDGPWPTGYAAQALAGQGIAVLQVTMPSHERPEPEDPSREGARYVERIDAAIASLAASGTVDADRVGLIGFSRAGYVSYYALTHPGRTRFRAAVFVDGFTGNYGPYLMFAAVGLDLFSNQAVQVNGGGFWRNPQAWLANSPGFNVHRSRTPMLYLTTIDGAQTAAIAAEVVGAFRLNRRPIEMVHFPRGAHTLRRPRQRLASMEANVDWMRFWLQGRASGDPVKADQDDRWRRLRTEWERQQAWEDAGHPVGSAPATASGAPSAGN